MARCHPDVFNPLHSRDFEEIGERKSMQDAPCEHFENLVVPVSAASTGCDQCLESGSDWVHLRACLTCGTVGCCDNSKGRHARGHWEEDGHPLIRSMEPGEDWLYCFSDKVLTS